MLTGFLLLTEVSFSRTWGPERSLWSMINWPARFNMMLSAMQAWVEDAHTDEHSHRHLHVLCVEDCLYVYWCYLLRGFQCDASLCSHRG